jgi:hypothetical protein
LRPVRQPYLSYRPARLHRLAESMPRSRFLGFINVYKYGLSTLRAVLRRYDMNGGFQMQGGKNWILSKEMNAPVLLGLSLAGNLVKPLLSLYGTKWRERGNGLCMRIQLCEYKAPPLYYLTYGLLSLSFISILQALVYIYRLIGAQLSEEKKQESHICVLQVYSLRALHSLHRLAQNRGG